MENKYLNELILKIDLKSNKAAFNEIFDYFAPKVIGYLISSGSKREVAEEITQEVMTTIWLKSSQFNHKKGNVNTWIFTIARNKRIDRLRKNENPGYSSIDLIEALYGNNLEKNKELEEKVMKMQSNLNNEEKKLIKMNFLEGKTHKKISSDLEIPLGTVKSRIRNILTKMKN